MCGRKKVTAVSDSDSSINSCIYCIWCVCVCVCVCVWLVRGTGCRLQGRPASGRRSSRTWSGSYTGRRTGGGRNGVERRPLSSKEERHDQCRAPGLSTRASPRPATALGGRARQRGPLTPELPRTQTGECLLLNIIWGAYSYIYTSV